MLDEMQDRSPTGATVFNGINTIIAAALVLYAFMMLEQSHVFQSASQV